MSPPVMPFALPPFPGMTQEGAQSLVMPLDAIAQSMNTTFASLNTAAASVLAAFQAPFRTSSPAPITAPIEAFSKTIKENIINTLPSQRKTDQRAQGIEASKQRSGKENPISIVA